MDNEEVCICNLPHHPGLRFLNQTSCLHNLACPSICNVHKVATCTCQLQPTLNDESGTAVSAIDIGIATVDRISSSPTARVTTAMYIGLSIL